MLLCTIRTYLIQREGLGECKSPSGLKGATDHGRSGRGRRRCQSERIGELDSAHLDADIDRVDRRVELGQFRLGGDGDAVQALRVARPFKIVHCDVKSKWG